MNDSAKLAEQILDTALRLADECTWEQLRLHDIAREMDIPLSQIQQHYRQKDDLVEAWYDRADAAMLASAEDEAFHDLAMAERLQRIIMVWLNTLATHKTVSRDMLLYKLEPAHIHLQLLGILRVSRTVQWMLEAAQSESTHLQRIAEEIGLTTIYLLTFNFWMTDHSEQHQATQSLLKRKLNHANSLAGLCCCRNTKASPQRVRADAQEPSPDG